MRQRIYPVFHRNIKVDEYIPDLEIKDLVISDTKVIEKIGDNEIGQMLNYLKITQKSVGLILNFKHSKLEWRKITYLPESNSN